MNSAPTPESTTVAADTPAVLTPGAPSVHTRAFITWLAIFPLVAITMVVSAPLIEGWHPVLRSLALTLVVVPAAVYVVVPRLFAGYHGLMRRRNAKR